jgi:hypothetical protein
MAAAGSTGDVTTKVFREATYDLIRNRLRDAPEGTSTFGSDLNQGRLRVWSTTPDVDSNTFGVIEVSRHGPVTAGLGRDVVYDGLGALVDTIEVLRPQWANAAAVLASFAGEAPAHVRVSVWHPALGITTVSRWSRTIEPWEDDLAAIRREFRRHTGYPDWEP